MTSSAPSSFPYMRNAIPMASPRMIFSCWVSCAYWIISSYALGEAVPSMVRPIAYPDASPATAESMNSTSRRASYTSEEREEV